MHLQSWVKYMTKGQKSKQNWTRAEIFGVCFLAVSYRNSLKFISKGEPGD